ncbi:hypothetical protein b3_0335 [Synechococcus phage B3]|nr:hypothetical protein b3_0335 [Synechococcus phage B3]QGT54940.1 hypothetical protein b23_0329 [Synechococcus phage B23]
MLLATAHNNPRDSEKHTVVQVLSAADVPAVHVTPSGDVMTRLPVPNRATAHNNPKDLEKHTEAQLLSIVALVVHVTPSGDVMTELVALPLAVTP